MSSSATTLEGGWKVVCYDILIDGGINAAFLWAVVYSSLDQQLGVL